MKKGFFSMTYKDSGAIPGGALRAETIYEKLPDELRGVRVFVFDRVRSTNDTAATLLKAEREEPFLAVFAEHQEGGRGRRGRAWSSPPGRGLLGTCALAYPPGFPSTPGIWPLLAALSVRAAIADLTGLAVSIKWPNDLLIGGKKVCGILTEWIPVRDGCVCLAIGAGTNVNTELDGLPPEVRERATSLLVEAGVVYDRSELAAKIVTNLFHTYAQTLRGADFSDYLDEMLTHCATLGQHVRIMQGQEWIEGIAQTIDHQGALHVLLADGSRRKLISGEIVETHATSFV